VDGAAITPIVRPISINFSPSAGSYGLSSDGGGLPIFHTQWTGSLGVNVAQILNSESVPFTLGATSVAIDIVNTLNATSEAGTQSLIAKKDFGLVSITIPEPGTGFITGLGIASLAAGRRFHRVVRQKAAGKCSLAKERSNDPID
jgi:hypothetical protein